MPCVPACRTCLCSVTGTGEKVGGQGVLSQAASRSLAWRLFRSAYICGGALFGRGLRFFCVSGCSAAAMSSQRKPPMSFYARPSMSFLRGHVWWQGIYRRSVQAAKTIKDGLRKHRSHAFARLATAGKTCFLRPASYRGALPRCDSPTACQ